jgi:hypothetical protein
MTEHGCTYHLIRKRDVDFGLETLAESGVKYQGAVVEAKRRMLGEALILRRMADFRGPLGMASRAERKRRVGVVARARLKTVLIILGGGC